MTDTIANLELCFDSFDALTGGLTPEQWATKSLCPDWDMAGVVVHLAAVEHMLSGQAPDSMETEIPFGRLFEYVAAAEGQSPADALAAYREVIATRRSELAGLTADDLAAPCMTPKGLATYGKFLEVRVFDYWIHEHDMRTPLGISGHEGGPAADMALDEIVSALPYIAGKKIGLPDGSTMTIELTGPVTRTVHVAVDGRAAVVDSLDSTPTVTLTAQSTAFAQLACGRIDPDTAIADGHISWTGDDTWGATAARNLAYTT